MAKPGPKPKPPKWKFTAEVPIERREELRAAAAAEGVALCEYVSLVLARAHGWPEPAHLRNRGRHGEDQLPLQKTA